MSKFFLFIFLNLLGFGAYAFDVDILYQEVAIGKNYGLDVDTQIKDLEQKLDLHAFQGNDFYKASLVLTNLYKFKGDHTHSLRIAESTQKIAKQEKEYLWQARFLGFMASGYRAIHLNDMSEQALRQAIQAARKAPGSEELYRFNQNVYHEWAYHSFNQNKYDDALKLMRESNNWIDKMQGEEKKFSLAINYQFMGIINNKQEQYDAAIFHFSKALNLIEEGDPGVQTAMLTYFIYSGLGHAYLEKGDQEQAFHYLNKVRKRSLLEVLPFDLNSELYTHLITYYQNEKQADSLRFYVHKRDSLNRLAQKGKFASVNEVAKELAVENSKLKKNLKLYLGVFAVTVVLLGAVIVFRKRLFTFSREPQSNSSLSRRFSVSSAHVREVLEEGKSTVNIARDTELRLIQLIQQFENDEKFLDPGITVTMVASQFHTNNRYVTHILKKMYDKDFTTYINDLRVHYIVTILREDPSYRDYKISYLSEVAGFSSYNKFSSNFKRVMGVSPSEFIVELY